MRRTLAGAFVAGQVVAFATAAHRYSVGTNGRLLYFLDPEWRGPVNHLALLVIVAVASTMLARQLGRGDRPPSEEVSVESAA